jgi:predicted DNA-binding transcriptional regulator YafY
MHTPMSDRISKTQRWLDLLAYLVGRRLPVAVDELMEHVPAYTRKWRSGSDTDRASVRRMFERDKDELRQLGIPIETISYDIRGTPGEEVLGYRLARRDFYLPYLRVVSGADVADVGAAPAHRGDPARVQEVQIEASDAEDAIQALREVAELPAFPYAREARSALRKLGFDLGPMSAFPAAPPSGTGPGPATTFFAADASTAAVSDSLRTLTDALFARKTASFRYHGIERGASTEREVQPYGLLFQHSRWYLVAFDPMRDGMRVFRVDRMEAVARNAHTPNTPDYEIPVDFRLAEYAQKQAWELGEANGGTVHALVRFDFPRSLWAERNGHGELVEEHDDGASVRSFDVTQPDPFLRWILSMAGEALIVSPAELADDLRAMAAAAAKAHGGGA